MAAEPKREDTEPEPPTPTKINRKRLREFEEHGAKSKERKLKGALLAAYKPSYCLLKGIGDWHCGGESHRHQHRERLSRLLHDLVRQQNWAEASGVMSVLLQATATDKSISRNRAKYSVALELLNNVKGESISSRRIQGVYELWMKKLGHLKNWCTKERFAVQLEFILACLQRGNLEDAYQAAICVMQQPGFNSDSIANLMVGLAFYQLWYVDIPRELQLKDLDSTGTNVQPEVHNDDGTQLSVDFSVDNALEAGVSYGQQCDSSTSVAIDKVTEVKASQLNESMNVDETVKKEPSHFSFQSSISKVEPDVLSENSEYSNYSDDLPRASVFYSKGLPRWLLPIKLTGSQENLEVALNMHRKLNNSHYKTALKCLRAAVYSTPPLLEAIHPYIQMLLLGDQVQEAVNEVENLSQSMDTPTVLLLRMKASLTENFDRGNYARLSTCFEDVLKKDPTCSNSLSKLSLMHRRGEYDTRTLVEMIAHHLDSTYGTCDVWKELASCILRISHCEEDRISTFSDQEHVESSYSVPELFTTGKSREEWRFRARWWLRRHFSHGILMSDISSGDSKLLAYKASTASHIYGRQFKYVVKAGEAINNNRNDEVSSFFQLHTRNAVGFYSSRT